MPETTPIPVHQWTHDDGRVLLVKCVARGGRSYGGFQWPRFGIVDPGPCSLEPTCESGGLFGWPWGVNLGGGREPDHRGDWIVFAADPALVVDLGDKCKVAGPAEVLYYGAVLGALIYTLPGRVGWVQQNADGSASSTGWSGSASSTGESGSASSTGWRSSASSTGARGSASSTGWRSSASSTGESGSASSTGWSGSASSTGESGSASSTGWRSSASSTGARGSASSTGWRSSASSTGERGIAALAGNFGSIEVGPTALGAVTAQQWTWVVHPGAVVACRWADGAGAWHSRLLEADAYAVEDGVEVNVSAGVVDAPHR